jgi:hypothetical protein
MSTQRTTVLLAAGLTLALALSAATNAGGAVPPMTTATSRPTGGGVRATTIAEAWRALPVMHGHRCGDDLVFDYGAEGGMRNFFCRALSVFSWKTFLKLAPSPVFARGPHRGARLDLQAKKDFGHYSPAFVRWATEALVPAHRDGVLRAETQEIYDAELRKLARTYFLVRSAIEAAPGWLDGEQSAYRDAVRKGTVAESFWDYSDVLGGSDTNWGGYDPSLVRSATMWWIRRELDGTAALWKVGLVRLLTTYDPTWLQSGDAKPTRRSLPRTLPATTPEYR